MSSMLPPMKRDVAFSARTVQLLASGALFAAAATCQGQTGAAQAADPSKKTVSLPTHVVQVQTQLKDSHGRPWKQREVRLLTNDGTLVKAATTGADGAAQFQGVAPGQYLLEVTGATGEAIRQKVAVTDSGSNTFSLVTDVAAVPASASAQVVPAVTVSGVKTPTQPGALRTDIVTTESIDAHEMQKIGATSLIDALTHRPGIDVQVECSVCNVRSITLDNLPGRFTTLELDGVPIFSPVSNAYGLDMLGVNGLERIDVSRGAATSLTTPESLAGTVNLVSKVPTEDVAVLDAEGGDYGYQREALYLAKAFSWGALSLNATNQDHDSVDGVGYGISQFTGYQRELFGTELSVNDFLGFRIKARYDHIKEDRGGGPLGTNYAGILNSTTGNPFNWSAGPYGSPVSNTWVVPSTGKLLEPPYDGGEFGLAQIIFTQRNQFVTTAEKDLNDDTKLHLSFGYAHHQQGSWYGGDSDYWDHQQQVYLDANVQKEVGDGLVTAGLNYKFEELRSQSISESAGTPYFGVLRDNVDAYTYRTPGLYLQGYKAFFHDRLELNASIREDDNNDFGAITTPRLDALWHHSDELSSRFAIGTGYRLPTSFFEQDHGILSAISVDRSHAAPEQSQNASYSLNYADDRLTATTSLNYTRIRDMALFVDNAANEFVLEPAQHPFTVASADLSATYKVTPTNAVTLGLEGYHYQFYAADAANAALFSRPNYRVSLGYDHDAGRWDFNVRSTFTGPQDLAKWYDYQDNPIYNLNGSAKPDWSPAFWEVDTHASYQVNKWLEVHAGINNLFNYQQAKHDSFLFQDPYGNLNVTYIWGPNIGRTFVAGATFTFQ